VKRSLIVALAMVASPLLTFAETPRGSCEYTTNKPGAEKLTFCTHVADESLCTAEATRKASPDWIKAHPPRFKAGGDCTNGGKALKTSNKKAKASAKQTPRKEAKSEAPAAADAR